MCGDTISAKDLAKLGKSLANVMQQTKSLEELENWLRSQRFVKSVRLSNYIIKTEPPQKELLVVFKMDDGSSITKVIDVKLHHDQILELAGFHDP